LPRLNPEGETDRPTEPLPVRLFRLRLDKLRLQRGRNEPDAATLSALKGMIALLPMDNINIRPHRETTQALETVWPESNSPQQERLSRTIAPLMRYVWAWSLPELQFRVVCERLATAWLAGDAGTVENLREDVLLTLKRLADNVPEVAQVAEARAHAMSDSYWEHLTVSRIDELQETFAPLTRYRIAQEIEQVELHLPDQIASRRWVVYGPTGEGAFADTYREKVEASVRQLAESLPALVKLKRGEPLDDVDLLQIAFALNQTDWFITEDTLKTAYQQPAASFVDLLRHILGVSKLPSNEERINEEFERFIREHQFLRASQLNYLRAVRAAVLRRAHLTRNVLSQPPISRVGDVEQLFKPEEIDQILAFANRLVEQVAVN
jgi:type I restriction enzyme, R subunit